MGPEFYVEEVGAEGEDEGGYEGEGVAAVFYGDDFCEAEVGVLVEIDITSGRGN